MLIFNRNVTAAVFMGIGLTVGMAVQAQQKPLFAWDDPAFPKKVAMYEKGLAWAVETLPTLPIKEGVTCKQGTEPSRAFAEGEERTITNVYVCGIGGWHKIPLQFSRGADQEATIKRADLEKMESWLLDSFPSLYNLGAHDATQAGVACDKKFEGVTGIKYAGGGHLSRVLANVLRCEGGTWKAFPNLADLPT